MSSPSADDDLLASGLQVVRGEPDEAELVALVAGLMATVTVDDEPAPLADAWTDRARRLAAPPAPGPTAWRWSLHP